MTRFARQIPSEVVFTLGMLLIMLALSFRYHLPILWPKLDSGAFVGVHYLLPLLGIMVWSVCATLGRRSQRARTLLVALPCYALVLWAHFNIKLWAPHINPTTYDSLFWSADQAMRPLVEASFAIRRWLAWIIPYRFNVYMYAFILLFYVSFCYHALKTPAAFRRMFLAVLFLQGLGALAYLAFPALGPFLYEDGVNPFDSAGQHYMLAVHDHSVRRGVSWLAANGSRFFMTGLGAMPSLHAAGSFLFLWFAARYARVLVPVYALVFCYILVVAVANRWHYIVDLPFGIALACLSIYLAYKLDGETTVTAQAETEPRFGTPCSTPETCVT